MQQLYLLTWSMEQAEYGLMSLLINARHKPITRKEIVSLLAKIAGERQEHFVVITLDAGCKLISSRVVFIGTVTSTLVHPREIFAQAISDLAVSIVVSHNHPSGDPAPSKQDIDTTQQLIAAGQILGIDVDDHIIVAGGRHFSFVENGLMIQNDRR
jgi:DNA repair protein RadC